MFENEQLMKRILKSLIIWLTIAAFISIQFFWIMKTYELTDIFETIYISILLAMVFLNMVAILHSQIKNILAEEIYGAIRVNRRVEKVIYIIVLVVAISVEFVLLFSPDPANENLFFIFIYCLLALRIDPIYLTEEAIYSRQLKLTKENMLGYKIIASSSKKTSRIKISINQTKSQPTYTIIKVPNAHVAKVIEFMKNNQIPIKTVW